MLTGIHSHRLFELTGTADNFSDIQLTSAALHIQNVVYAIDDAIIWTNN